MKFSRTKVSAAVVGAVSLALIVSGCSSNGGGSNSTSAAGSITYWASNQSGTTTAADVKILKPILAHFTKETGIKVNLEVIGWGDLQNNINNAVSSGSGPDVVNIGNTWAPYLAATKAFVPFEGAAAKAIGGTEKFIPTALATGGLAGQAPTSVPYIGLSYGLFYNKAMFAGAGLKAPTTWEEMVADAQKLTKGGVYGMGLEGGSYTENVHFAFITAEQNGGEWYDSSGKPTFTTDANVQGVLRYLNLMQDNKVVNKSNAEYSNGTEAMSDFAKGKVAMVVNQNNGSSTLTADGMTGDKYGVAAIPTTSGGKNITSGIQGINLSIFKNSPNQAADLKFVNFMTSAYAQNAIGLPYATIPVVKGVAPSFSSDKDFESTFTKIYDTTSAPYPLVASEGAFEQQVGTALNGLFATVATGGKVTSDDVKKALQTAQDKVLATQ
ncbi:ABC transporter substrate-binding protein [Diaminobutyricibacter sp. McL0618]|uniref:ABC transporter substrate-binding protein n=1 Tax=Leifsonia sp. McL0618 TaxID=3415677 RepID=UPI003CF910C8